MSLVDENPCGEFWKNNLCGSKKGENPDYVGFRPCAPAEKLKPHLAAYYFLCFIVYFLSVMALLGGRCKRKRCKLIFFGVPADVDPVFPQAEGFSGLRPFRLCLLSFAEVFQIQLIDMLKTRRCGCQSWMWRKELLPDTSVVWIFSLFWIRGDCILSSKLYFFSKFFLGLW